MKFAAILMATVAILALAYFFVDAWLPKILISMGTKDKWWSIVRLKPKSGQYAVMAHGEKNGPMAKIIGHIPGHYLDTSSNDPSEWTWKQGTDPDADSLNFIKKYLDDLGLVYVGFNKAYYREKTEYITWEKLPNKPESGLVSKTRNVKEDDPYYFFNYTFAAKAEGVETSEEYPVDLVTVFTVRHRQPVKVLFMAGKWAVRADAAAESAMREYGNGLAFDVLTSEKTHGSKTTGLVGYMRQVFDPASSDPESIGKKFGLEIDDPSFMSIEITPGSQAAKIAEATTTVAIETQLANGKEQKARGIKAESRARVEGGGEHAGTFALAEAIKENTTATTLVIGNTNIAVPTK